MEEHASMTEGTIQQKSLPFHASEEQKQSQLGGMAKTSNEVRTDESSAAILAAALEDIKIPKLDTGRDHILNTGKTTLAVESINQPHHHDELLVNAATQEGVNTVSTGDTAMLVGGAGYVDKNSSSLAKLVRGWETYIAEGARNVQMLQNIHLCGAADGLGRITGETDGTEPFLLRHIHSSPLQYSSSNLDKNTEASLSSHVPMDQVRRSSSTPSTSAFRQRSANSAFGVHLRTLPYVNGPDDRSAFTLPLHRRSFAVKSDSGIRYSAFEPIPFTRATAASTMDDTEKIAIEVTSTDVGTIQEKDPAEESNPDDEKIRSTTLGAASRAARFLSDVRFSRRRRRVRGGRENPARPSSDPSPPQEPTVTLQVAVVDESTDQSETPPTTTTTTTSSSSLNLDRAASSSLLGLEFCESQMQGENTDMINSFPLISEDQNQVTSIFNTTVSSSEHYHQLDSDIDDECEEYQRIEALIQADSPGTIPSPSYQQILDDRPNSAGGPHEALPSIRIQVSSSVKSSRFCGNQGNTQTETVSSPNPCEMVRGEGSSLTPQSQDSGRHSRSTHTTNTSAHAPSATSTSATFSSGHLSAISETDREVMEANKLAKMRRVLVSLPIQVKNDADSSVNSSSTSSTNHGYVALMGNSATLRDGANVPADRFFKLSSPGATTGIASTANGQSQSRASSLSAKGGSTNSPTTISSASVGHTSSSSSSGEDPPTFVSYLDRQAASDLTSLREEAISTERTSGEGAEERESPSEIVGYTDVIFEEADGTEEGGSPQPRPIQPRKQQVGGRTPQFRYRPPRSPVKGSRPLATPPPLGNSGDAVSPANYHLSPPRNIVENPIETNLSRPSVLRSAPLAPVGPLLVTPDNAESSRRPILLSSPLNFGSKHMAGAAADREQFEILSTANESDELERGNRAADNNVYIGISGMTRERGPGRVHTFVEGGIEIWKTDSKDEAVITGTVSPEKEVGEM